MSEGAFDVISGILRARSGIVLERERGYLLDTRLLPLLRRHDLAGLEALAARLRTPGAEPLVREVVEALTTNESSFFRDSHPFDYLRRALPRIAAARPAGQRLRLWSAACSTGQEAYSAAMVLDGLGLGGRSEILGTDLSQAVVERAREGSYTAFEVRRGLPPELLARHFTEHDGRWRVSAALRGRVRFEVANLLDDPRRHGSFDVIFCRNVLIYFDVPTKTRVLEALAGRLAPDGLLYLGGAETVLGLTEALVPVPGERGAHAPVGGLALAG